MTDPNVLVFVDFPSSNVNEARAFYAEVFNWEVEDRIADTFARIVPGGHFKNEDGTPSEIGNLHMGISSAANMRPHKDPTPSEPTHLNPGGRAMRAWIMVSEDDSFERILETAVRLGGTELWREHFWTEFGGCNASFIDPWGNQIMLWQHLPDTETDDDTHEVVGEVNLPPGWTIE
ncbi:MAG: glyoxalase [Acidimicrobiaceae bacterium]|nr:glyoxalase [Acidimicrobiaceae bacterium]HAB57050.1 glyoxalase [Acidimicrobiaceae bacterium]